LNWLLDTCVLSEYAKRRPHAGVLAWLDAQPEAGLFISEVSLAEIAKGIAKLRARQGATDARVIQLQLWLARLGQRFEGRTLPVNDAVWRLWAEQSASAERDGQPLSPMDGLIMASALSRGLGLVTRNTADFARHPQVFNPWAA
jgi:predicted nucleic acid-binding protein